MLFTAAGLQQASGEPVADHRAAALRGRRVADLTCGIGGDSARPGRRRRPPAGPRPRSQAACASRATTLRAYGRRGRRSWRRPLAPPLCAGAATTPSFATPGGAEPKAARIFRPADLRATPGSILHHYAGTRSGRQGGAGHRLCAAPGMAPRSEGRRARWRSSSLHGDVKEAVLWRAAWPRRALRRRATLLAPRALPSTDADAPDACPVTEPQAYLYEPDGAVIRAGLVRPLAASARPGADRPANRLPDRAAGPPLRSRRASRRRGSPVQPEGAQPPADRATGGHRWS